MCLILSIAITRLLFLKIGRRERKGNQGQHCPVMLRMPFWVISQHVPKHICIPFPCLSPDRHPRDAQNWRLKWFRKKIIIRVRVGTCKFCCLTCPSLITADGELIKEQSWLSEQISVCEGQDKRTMPSLLFMVINWVEFTSAVAYLSRRNEHLNMKYYISSQNTIILSACGLDLFYKRCLILELAEAGNAHLANTS